MPISKKTAWFAGVSSAAVLLLGTAAYAASPHLKGAVSFTDLGVALEAAGFMAGLGTGTGAAVNMSAQANVFATCTNPSGQNQPPGQNPAPITVTGSSTIDPGSIDHNGTAPFDVIAGLTTRTISGAPDCPGGNWTEFVQDLAFTSAVISVFQNNASTTVATCTFSPPTSDGAVPASSVSCSK
jgi:hypothetical protein